MEESNRKSNKKTESVKQDEKLKSVHQYKDRNGEKRRYRKKDRDRERSEDEKYKGREKRYREERSKELEREMERKRRERDTEKMRKIRRECERDHSDRDRKRRRSEDSVDNNSLKKTDENASNKYVVKTGEEDMEEEQRKLDYERENRRRRVQNWQEKRRKTEKSEREQLGVMEEDEIDPLDAFMNSVVIPEVNRLSYFEPSVLNQKTYDSEKDDKNKKSGARSMGRIIPGEDSDVEDDDRIKHVDDNTLMKKVKKSKLEKLVLVDHSKINYIEFRKNLYIEVNEIKKMTQDEVAAYRQELELKVHGKNVPKPIKTWYQTGLTTKILDTIRNLNYDTPMAVQAQALPVIMSGRDCIAVAKTGSGKTLAFILPMLRHITNQPKLSPEDGPIGLIMAPTRELVRQIHSDIRTFTKGLGIRCVLVYGGSGVPKQILELKRGAEIVVCTPGRMIDMLCTSGGKITNLRRVSYLVMDEADRMFDMGFEPQITRIIQNVQPNRQTVLFSATFPRKVEILARKILNKPVEIVVGGKSVVNKDITQLVEIIPEDEKFVRLLELVNEWNAKGKILIFVQTQGKCDALVNDLVNKHGYRCLSLHGGKDQSDRESTICNFKSNVCNLLVATSVAARGLDVKDLELVVNYDVPNHYEDYVHRVGRTGRAGRKGCAVTFISTEDERYAPDVVKALTWSNQVVNDGLKALVDGFMWKVNRGLVIARGTGYGGSGFKFNDDDDEVRKAVKKAEAEEYGFEEGKPVLALPGIPDMVGTGGDEGGDRVADMAAVMRQQVLDKIQTFSLHKHCEAELEINDLPQNVRWKVTRKETLRLVGEWAGASVTVRGKYIQPGRLMGPGEKKLYLLIKGGTEECVKRAEEE